MNILEVKNLKKHYPKVKAVDGISFEIPKGICFGLLGPNGAGKSTTLEIIEGVKTPTSGEVLYSGQPLSREIKHRLGVQFQSTALQDYMTVKEALKTFEAFYDSTVPMDELIETCQLQDILEKDHKKLSGGQRQRVLLALAIINNPELVMLDEPTTGLDPQSRKLFWTLIDNIKKQGKTIILTTHYMEEASSLCDDLVIVDHGKIIAHGSPQELLAKHSTGVRVSLGQKNIQLPEGVNGKIMEGPMGTEILTDDVNKCLKALVSSDIDLSQIEVKKFGLEDLFIALTGEGLREG